MTKQIALGDSFFVGQYDLSGDIGSLGSLMASRAIIDISSIQTSGYERLLGRADGQIAFNAFYNPTAGQSHPVLDAVATAAGTAVSLASYFHGATVGNDAASLQGKQMDYNVNVGADQAIAIAATVQAGSGVPLEWGLQLTTGKQTFASGTVSGTSIDNAAATSFGAAAYLHSFSIATGTATVTIQDSADNVTFAAVSGMAFTAVSAASSERIATTKTATIRRYVRVQVTGTYTSLVAAVSVVVYPTSQT